MAVITFDVNETLLDLAGLDVPFAAHFGARGGEMKRLWFARLLQMSGVVSVIGSYADFGVLGRTVLLDYAERLGMPINEQAAGEVQEAMGRLEPHADAIAGITAFKQAGHRVVALTNSGQASAEAQLAHAGLAVHLERILTVEPVLRFKPDPAVYAHAGEQLGVGPSELVMIACHDWDCAGAMKAGWRSGYVARPGTGYNRLLQPPTWRGEGLLELAEAVGDGR